MYVCMRICTLEAYVTVFVFVIIARAMHVCEYVCILCMCICKLIHRAGSLQIEVVNWY
jgi:hypothetical protein